MEMNEARKRQAAEGYGNLGSDTQGLQKVANDKARHAALTQVARGVDDVSGPAKEPIKEEKLSPINFEERLNKYLRG